MIDNKIDALSRLGHQADSDYNRLLQVRLELLQIEDKLILTKKMYFLMETSFLNGMKN